MPLPVPVLDDRTFADLVLEGRALIPRYSRDWANHNVSDPGITLLELLAYAIEGDIFELDQIPRETLDVFLELVGVCREPDETVETAVGRALDQFEDSPVVLTAGDFTERALELTRGWQNPVARAELTWIVDERCRGGVGPFGDPDAGLVNVRFARRLGRRYALSDRLYLLLKEHAIVGTRFHVVPAPLALVEIATVVARVPGSTLRAVDVERRIREFIDPTRGGFEGSGWPMGRSLYRSELFEVLEAIPGVEHVESLALARIDPGLPREPVAPGEEGLDLDEHELIDPESVVTVEVR
jgi:hypothetical protein